MSDEFGNWRELAALWHARIPEIMPEQVERHARLQRRHMLWLAIAEAVALGFAFIAAVWIAMHTALVAMSAVSLVFFGLSGYLHHRLRNEPEAAGNQDLMSSLEEEIARERWSLRQLGIGRAITLVTLAAILLLGLNHLRFLASTPPERLWAMLAIALLVLGVLLWNLTLTRRVKARLASLVDYTLVLGA